MDHWHSIVHAKQTILFLKCKSLNANFIKLISIDYHSCYHADIWGKKLCLCDRDKFEPNFV